MMTYSNVLCEKEPGYRYSLEIPGKKALYVSPKVGLVPFEDIEAYICSL